MHFHGLPELLLGSRVRLATMRALFTWPHREWTGRELARETGISPTQVLAALRTFQGEGICTERRIGKASVWALKPGSFLVKRLSAIARLDEDARTLLSRSISRSLRGSGASEAYVFGSVALAREAAGSDIDLLVVFPTQARLDAWRLRLEGLRETTQARFGSFLSPTLLVEGRLNRGNARRLLQEARSHGLPVEVQ